MIRIVEEYTTGEIVGACKLKNYVSIKVYFLGLLVKHYTYEDITNKADEKQSN